MSTNFGSAGIPGTRLKVCVWVGGGGGGGGGSHTHYCITPVPILGAGALMLNAWDWTVTIKVTPQFWALRFKPTSDTKINVPKRLQIRGVNLFENVVPKI